MKVIVEHRRTKVYFDEKREVYIKEFNPKLSFRLKYFFRLRKYPGFNFKFISRELAKLGIKTPEIIYASKYRVETKKIDGVLLSNYLKNKQNQVLVKYLDMIVKVLKSDIYFGDFNTRNFIVKNGDIYAIDLEDYRKERFFNRSMSEALMRLKKTLKNDKWYEYIEEKLNSV